MIPLSLANYSFGILIFINNLNKYKIGVKEKKSRPNAKGFVIKFGSLEIDVKHYRTLIETSQPSSLIFVWKRQLIINLNECFF